MIVGRTRPGDSPLNLTAGRLLVEARDLAVPAHCSHLAAYVDGDGPVPGVTRLRAVIYDAAGALVVAGGRVDIPDGAPAGWLQLPAGPSAGILLPAATYRVGVHVGGITGCGRLYVDDPGGASSRAVAPFTAGPPATLPALIAQTSSLPIYLSGFEPWTAPAVADLELSRLPWDLTQRVFGAGAGIATTRATVTAGWHGTSFDEETGAVAVARRDGPLAGLVGERLRITRNVGALEHRIAVYVHTDQAFPDALADEDLSLPRSAFLRLAPWPTDTLPVTVEVLG